jgi:hypothetical protein
MSVASEELPHGTGVLKSGQIILGKRAFVIAPSEICRPREPRYGPMPQRCLRNLTCSLTMSFGIASSCGDRLIQWASNSGQRGIPPEPEQAGDDPGARGRVKIPQPEPCRYARLGQVGGAQPEKTSADQKAARRSLNA